jgi:acetolactate synthase-1/2/3 large subunit
MQEADLVITVGRRLDYQLAYGSPAIFREATAFLRIGTGFEETSENRRGDVEIQADAEATLRALIDAQAFPEQIDTEWSAAIRSENRIRQRKLTDSMSALSPDHEGLMHPLFLVNAINRHIHDDAILVTDGGDILSFARMGLRAVRSLDCGSLGCLGVGVPFATAAALACPSRQVFALIGDGAFGFSALELSTAARHHAKVLFVIANNAGWNIDRHDQIRRYGAHLVGVELPAHRYDLLAEGLGVYGQLVARADQLEDSIDRALNRLPALLNVRVSREPTSPDFNNGLAEVPSHQALRRWDELEKQRYA